MAIAVAVMVIANVAIDSMLGMMQREMIDARMRLIKMVPATDMWIDGVQFPTKDTVRFSRAHLRELKQRLGDAAEQVGWVDSSARRVFLGNAVRGVVTFTVLGDPALAEFEGPVPRAFTDFEVETSDSAVAGIPVLISGALDRILAKSRGVESSVGESLRLGEESWHVVGVAADSERKWSLRAWRPARDRNLENGSSPIVLLAPVTENLVGVVRLAQQAEQWIEESEHSVGNVVVRAPGLNEREAGSAKAQLFRAVLSTFALLCIVLAAAGVSAVQLAGLPSRTREIGIRRSVGARRRDISREVLRESALVGLSGSALGAIAGIVLSTLMVRFLALRAGQPLELELHVASLLLPALVGVSAALASALWPARRAASLDPVAALRH